MHSRAHDRCSLLRRFFCMSTNLSRGQPQVHSIGLLWRLVRASMTIVGLVPPVYEVSPSALAGRCSRTVLLSTDTRLAQTDFLPPWACFKSMCWLLT